MARRRNGSPYGLSNAELKVVMLLVNGYTNPEIARLLCRAEGTVAHHVQGVLRRMGVRNRVEAAVAWVREQEMTRPPL